MSFEMDKSDPLCPVLEDKDPDKRWRNPNWAIFHLTNDPDGSDVTLDCRLGHRRINVSQDGRVWIQMTDPQAMRDLREFLTAVVSAQCGFQLDEMYKVDVK